MTSAPSITNVTTEHYRGIHFQVHYTRSTLRFVTSFFSVHIRRRRTIRPDPNRARRENLRNPIRWVAVDPGQTAAPSTSWHFLYFQSVGCCHEYYGVRSTTTHSQSSCGKSGTWKYQSKFNQNIKGMHDRHEEARGTNYPAVAHPTSGSEENGCASLTSLGTESFIYCERPSDFGATGLLVEHTFQRAKRINHQPHWTVMLVQISALPVPGSSSFHSRAMLAYLWGV